MSVVRLLAAVTGLICASDARAYYCSEPSEPYIPAGYSADYDTMTRAERDVEDYFDDVESYIDCLQDEIDSRRTSISSLTYEIEEFQRDGASAISEAENIRDEWDTAVRQFNAR
ncbi:hypothetical protein [Frigidibacter sp. SD6-1]|uniref:hypothetical protein n=1 Tax=Frigidibacter sp. SD6-1 TaxID=3032581 RepID=UPI0024DFA543|nr:hypothetical protein [Frigidibacter sp. SD6-1]